MRDFYGIEGYVNIAGILKICNVPFIFCVGGRGTGKTYTALQYFRDDGKRIMLLRRTATQLNSIAKDLMNPYKALALNEGFNYHSEPVAKNLYAVYEDDGDSHKLLAYMTALSTISGLRGFDASDVDAIVFDEFIAENHERPIKNEADAFFNAYETINRNRELQGRPPVQVLCLANANRLDNPIFVSLDIVKKITTMEQNGQDFTVNSERGYAVVLLRDSPISDLKKFTALYKLTAGDYAEMALDNKFAYDDLSGVISIALKEFEPLAQIGDIYLYKHKTQRKYYCSRHGRGSPPLYEDTAAGRAHFLRDHLYLRTYIIMGLVFYEDYKIKQYLYSLYGI